MKTNAANVNRQPNFEQVKGLSQAILSSVPVQNPYKSGATKAEDPRGPSVVNRVLDVMSRPLYGALNAVDKGLERSKGKAPSEVAFDALRMTSPLTNPQMLKDIWGGLSGKDKTTGKDVLETSGIDDYLSGPGKFAVGLGIDIAADPLTYTGVGLAGKLGKAAKESSTALSSVEDAAGRSAQSLSEEISRRAASEARNAQVSVPESGLRAPLPTEPPRTFSAGPGAPERADISPIIDEVPSLNKKPLELEAGPSAVADPHLDALRETLTRSKTGRSEISLFDEVTDPLEAVKILNKRIAEVKSPIVKNLLNKEAEKLSKGIDPASVLSEARVTPPPFPELTINQRWIDEAVSTADRFLRSHRMKNINHIGQNKLYNQILHSASKVRKDRRKFHVLQMLRIAEEQALKQGRHLVDAEGLSVRLSDVANMSGGKITPELVDDFRKARPSQQIEDLKSFTTPQVVSEILDPVMQTGKQIADEVVDVLPESRTTLMGTQLSKELGKLAEVAGASSKEAGAARGFIRELFNPNRDQLYSEIEKEARSLVRMSMHNQLDPNVLHKISAQTYKALGENPKILGRQIEQNRVVEGVMTKFATWWGAKDLKPFSREYIDTARNVAAAFAETMTPLVRATKPSQRTNAWRVAQGKMLAGSPEEQQLADQFLYLTERLMGTHGITDNAESVVFRSATLMDELNKELPKALQLINKNGFDSLGRQYEYGAGNWMHSWKEWDVKEPAEALYQLTRALQLVTRKNAMWDDAALRWGMPVKGGEFQHPVAGISRLTGTFFPKQIADQLTNLQKQLDRDVFKTPHKSIELFDKVQRMWKTGVTIYSPSHHIRNLNGDIYLAALDGVVSPKAYARATKILHAFPTRHKDLESVFNIMDPGLKEAALRSRPGNVVLTTKRGEQMTAEQVYQAAEAQGLFIRAMHIEDLTGDSAATFGAGFKPLGGRVNEAATRVSELRDHWVRLAHFTDVLSKSNKPLRTAIEEAGRRVKKFHPDGTDLTGFEQNVMRRVIPFYSWMRKATPLVIEGAIMRPHITMAFPKTMANMQSLTGIESEGPGDPFPMDQMFPDWIKEKGIGPILQPGQGEGILRSNSWRGSAPGYGIVNPTQPFIDQVSQIGKPGQTILSSLTPTVRIPMELLQGQNSLGIPLENVEGGVPGHLAQQIPAIGIGARITGATRDNEPFSPEQLLNWLTSAGLTGTGPYKSQAQSEIRDLMTQIAKDRRGDYR